MDQFTKNAIAAKPCSAKELEVMQNIVDVVADSTILQWLEMRQAGYACKDIAAQFDASPTYVRAVTNRVKNADAAHHDDQLEFAQ